MKSSQKPILSNFKQSQKKLNHLLGWSLFFFFVFAGSTESEGSTLTGFLGLIFSILLLTTIHHYFVFYRRQKRFISQEEQAQIKKTSKKTWYALAGIFVVFPGILILVALVADSNKFELDVAEGSYTKISNNLIETRTPTFDLQLSTKGVKELSIDGVAVLIAEKITYPIQLDDDKTIKISAKNKKGEGKQIVLMIDLLKAEEIAQRKEVAEEQARIQKEKAVANKKALADKERTNTKRDLTDTIQVYNEGLVPYEDWRLVEIIKKGRSSQDPELQNLSRQLQTLAENFQAKEFPQKRAAYAKELRNKLWEDDYEVKISGTAKDVLTIIHWSFAANKPKQEFQTLFRYKFYDLRFSKVRYMWYDGSEYSQYTIESLLDRKIKGLE